MIFLAGYHGNVVGGTSSYVSHSPIHVRTSSFGSNPQLYIPPPNVGPSTQQVMI